MNPQTPSGSQGGRLADRASHAKLGPLYRNLVSFATLIDKSWNTPWDSNIPTLWKLGEVADAYLTIVYSHGHTLRDPATTPGAPPREDIMEEIKTLCLHYENTVGISGPALEVYFFMGLGNLHFFAMHCSKLLRMCDSTQYHKAEACTAYTTAWERAQNLSNIHTLHLAAAYSVAAFMDGVEEHCHKVSKMLEDVIVGVSTTLSSIPGLNLSTRAREVFGNLLVAKRSLKEEGSIYAAEPRQPDWNLDCPLKNLVPPILRFIHKKEKETGAFYTHYYFPLA